MAEISLNSRIHRATFSALRRRWRKLSAYRLRGTGKGDILTSLGQENTVDVVELPEHSFIALLVRLARWGRACFVVLAGLPLNRYIGRTLSSVLIMLLSSRSSYWEALALVVHLPNLTKRRSLTCMDAALSWLDVFLVGSQLFFLLLHRRHYFSSLVTVQ